MKKNLRKRIISLVLIVTLCLASSTYVFASNDNSLQPIAATAANTAMTSAIMPRAIGSCVASDGMITSGYGGKLVLYLDRSYFDIYIRAGATGNANNGVYCTVTLPNGYTYPLGFVTADGSKTSYLCYDGTAPAGNYIFNFEGTDAGTTGFLAFIYSSY